MKSPVKPVEIAAPEEPRLNAPALIVRPKSMLPRLLPEYRIVKFPAMIGRHHTNDIELPFDSVSRYHARIEVVGHQLKVQDLKSSNGTFINGRRVQTGSIQDQDVLAFGSVEFTVSHAVHEPETPAPPTSGRHREESSETSVHFVAEDRPEQPQNVVEADIGEDSARIAALNEEITDSDHFKRAKERLVTLYRLQEVLRSTTDEKKLLEGVLDLLFQAMPLDRGAVLTRAGDPNSFQALAARSRDTGDGDPKNRDSIGISKTVLMRSLKNKVAILTSDAAADTRFNAADSILLHRIHSVICVPLISCDHFFGFIYLDTSHSIRAFNKEDLTFVASVAGEVSVHLLNLRMLQENIRNERMAAIGQTITGMAHNIKNVLILSSGGMELMARRLDDKSYDSIGETWNLVKRGIDRINQMVKDMLDYSRARVVEKFRCNVNDMLCEVQSTFSQVMKNRGVECVLELDRKAPAVMLDVDGLDKAICNLLTNALEVVPERNGKIILRSRYEDARTLLVEVEDNGPGIPAEVLPRLFTPFFTTKGAKGTGLGLAMTKKFVEDMGGKISVTTEDGAGTCFAIRIALDESELMLESTPVPPTQN